MGASKKRRMRRQRSGKKAQEQQSQQDQQRDEMVTHTTADETAATAAQTERSTSMKKSASAGSVSASSVSASHIHEALDGVRASQTSSPVGAKPVVDGQDIDYDEEDEDRTSWKTASRQLLVFAAVVWFGQIAIAVVLKKFGVIQQDINDIVVQKVVPSIQQKLGEGGLLPNFLDMDVTMPQWFHLSNESTAFYYWNRITNDTFAVGHIMKERERPGFQLHKKGAEAKYPLIMIPGFVTSGLEVWRGRECARKYFRQRMWGGISSAKQLLMERECFFEHMMLDPYTGKDPEGIRVRPSQGFEAADYFMPSYWVWAKIIENLADVGYDGSSMTLHSYDWRMAFTLLEERDGYLTKLKYNIEAYKKTTGKKVIIASHSLGPILVHHFFGWVVSPEGGNGGKTWVNDHVHAFINIAGAQLGVPKAATALLSGEMSDTVFMGPLGTLVEQFIGRKLRRELWSSWGAVWSMLPKGGNNLWSIGADLQLTDAEGHEINNTGLDYPEGVNPDMLVAPSNSEDHQRQQDEQENAKEAHTLSRGLRKILKHKIKKEAVPFFVMTHNVSNIPPPPPTEPDTGGSNSESPENGSSTHKRHPHMPFSRSKSTSNSGLEEYSKIQMPSVDQTIEFLQRWGSGKGPSLSSINEVRFDANEKDKSKIWHDVTLTPLPYAPDMTIYCLYGVGMPTERAYFYKRNEESETKPRPNSSKSGGDTDAPDTQYSQTDMPFVLDTSIEDPEHQIKHGVKYADGDHSVPLLSLGYMCADAWRREDSGLNPSGTKVVTREYKHRQEFDSSDPMRGGPYSADHVDILGNIDMMTDFIRIVTDHELDIVNEDIFESDILEIAARINKHGGLHKKSTGSVLGSLLHV